MACGGVELHYLVKLNTWYLQNATIQLVPSEDEVRYSENESTKRSEYSCYDRFGKKDDGIRCLDAWICMNDSEACFNLE